MQIHTDSQKRRLVCVFRFAPFYTNQATLLPAGDLRRYMKKMNITQIYLTLDYDTSENMKRSRYQNETTYIQLFVEECMRKNKVDLGAFNRLVFSEGGDLSKDFEVLGNNALPVAISDTLEELDALKTDREFHDYYIRKLIEGFQKLDSHYKSSFVVHLKPLLDAKYENDLYFEKKMAAKRIGGFRFQVVGRYKRTSFKLMVNVFHKNDLAKSEVIFECEPDMFVVKFEAYKVEITEENISVINKVLETTLERKVAEFI